ncbi:hypothetical protein ACLESD_18875 [Pyxidicoccus sp. 3LFB2]
MTKPSLTIVRHVSDGAPNELEPGKVELEDRRHEPRLPDESDIVRYLRTATVFAVTAGISRDLLAPERPIIDSLSHLTDGVWSWSNDLPYYVETYNAELPPAFIAHVRARLVARG